MSTGTAAGRTLGSLRDNRAFRLFWFSNLFFFGGVWTQTLGLDAAGLGWLLTCAAVAALVLWTPALLRYSGRLR